jgi:hypothetical protein
LSVAALFVLSLSSCTKESVTVSGPTLQEELPWQESLNDMDHAFQETMEELEPLKKLSDKELEALKSSTDMPADLAKLGVDVEAFQRHAQSLSAALKEARNLGASDEILVASIKKHSEPIVRKIESAYPDIAYAKATPCYDAYELDLQHATAILVGCEVFAIFTSPGWGSAACVVMWALEMTHVHNEYENCLSRTYGG